MKRFEIKDSEGSDLLEYFAKICEGFSPEELTRHNVAGSILTTTSSIVMRRNYLGLTQEELASRCGYTIRTISAIENNEVSPSFHRVVRVLYELGYEFELKERDPN
jgi:DNA-binding XRE family transcriptional regulator